MPQTYLFLSKNVNILLLWCKLQWINFYVDWYHKTYDKQFQNIIKGNLINNEMLKNVIFPLFIILPKNNIHTLSKNYLKAWRFKKNLSYTNITLDKIFYMPLQ